MIYGLEGILCALYIFVQFFPFNRFFLLCTHTHTYTIWLLCCFLCMRATGYWLLNLAKGNNHRWDTLSSNSSKRYMSLLTASLNHTHIHPAHVIVLCRCRLVLVHIHARFICLCFINITFHFLIQLRVRIHRICMTHTHRYKHLTMPKESE